MFQCVSLFKFPILVHISYIIFCSIVLLVVSLASEGLPHCFIRDYHISNVPQNYRDKKVCTLLQTHT